jgi:hypothetical protein
LRAAIARGAAQVVERGAQAFARGGARCASRVLDRGAYARGAARCFFRYLIVVPRLLPPCRDAVAAGEEQNLLMCNVKE